MKKSELSKKLDEYVIDLKYQEKASNSIDVYYRYAKLFIDVIQHDNDITKDDVMFFKKYIIEVIEFSSSTINLAIVCVNKFLHYCQLDDLKVKQIKVQDENTLDEIMTVSDFKRLLRYADDEMKMMMKLLAYTGIRSEELKFFTYENVKSKKMYVVVRNKGKNRKVPLVRELRYELLDYCKKKNIESGYIFPSPSDPKKMPHRTTIYRRLKKIAGAARVKKSVVYAHAFRHLFAITFLKNGGNPLNLADILGHYDIRTTQKYTKLTNTLLKEQIENNIKY